MKLKQSSHKLWKMAALAGGILMCGATLANAQQSPVVQKKLIEVGWDKPDTARLRANLKQMEQTPFDGVLIGVTGKDDAGKLVEARMAFSNTPWKREWFQSSVDDLKAIHSKKLTDNFIQVGVNPGNVDWFDDAGWKIIVEHWRIAAWIAKEGNVKGICFDAEPYVAPNAAMSYSAQSGRDKHTLEEYQAKVRQRGREVISAVASVDPHLMIFTFFMNSINGVAAQTSDPQAALQTFYYDLYPAFINGWLDAAPASMIFVDGCETQGYHANSQLDFLQTANLIRNKALSLVAPENRQKYLAQVRVSFGLYLDAYVNPSTSNWYIDPKGDSRTKRLQINTASAVDAANQYVWIYGEKNRWWPTPTTSVGPKYWTEVLPGIKEALLVATHPDLVIQQKIAELEKSGKLVNLLQNGTIVAKTPGWSNWQSGSMSHGTFAQDNSVNHGDDQSGSARMSGVAKGCFIQAVEVKPGEYYVVQAWNRQQGHGLVWVRVRWQNADGNWVNDASDVLLFNQKNASGKEGWRKIQGVVTVPEGTKKMMILLNAAKQAWPQDVAWFDDVHVYKIQ